MYKEQYETKKAIYAEVEARRQSGSNRAARLGRNGR